MTKWNLSLPALLALLATSALRAQEPELPPGLGEQPAQQPRESEEPGLPPGLGGDPVAEEQGQEPGLPPGLEATPPAHEPTSTAPTDPWQAPLGLTGFWETRAGTRTQRDGYQRSASIAESRLRLELDRQVDRFVFKAKADLLADALAGSWQPDLERGDGFIDLREASAAVSPFSWLDVKLGRQVLTWGTGDLLFVNDLFPKDWVSFFVGRDTEYLKAPSDALRTGVFTDVVNFDLVYTPRFDPDRFLTGERVSFYNPALGRRSGRDAIQDPDVPDDWFDDAEFAGRVYQNVAGVELAGYFYSGRWKSPGGFDPVAQRATFPRLDVYGLSARRQLAGGIANVELGYYDSRQDRGGGNPLVDNSQLRVLAGYERDLPELAESLTVGVQYYLETLLQYDTYRASLPNGAPVRDELRHVVTLRVTRLLLDQRLRLSLFGYFSPSDRDFYLRPDASYTIDDSWSVTVGGNLFAGERHDTFFGQFGPDSNVFAAVRLSF